MNQPGADGTKVIRTPQRRWLVLGIAAGVVVIGLVTWFLPANITGFGHRVPNEGMALTAVLNDGAPVFVTHDADGMVTVVAAVSTHLADDPMGWCESSETIEDIAHGTIWDLQGRYLAGPARSDLATYEFEELWSGRITIGQLVAPQGRSEMGPISGPRCTPDEYVIHPSTLSP